jgi:ABC-type phosphate transport system ATPase subunit
MATAVEVRDLKAWFGKTEALHGINMSVEARHATAVIGPSGCGKSTFIRCLNRMHETNPEAKLKLAEQIFTKCRRWTSAARWAWFFKNQIHFPR